MEFNSGDCLFRSYYMYRWPFNDEYISVAQAIVNGLICMLLFSSCVFADRGAD